LSGLKNFGFLLQLLTGIKSNLQHMIFMIASSFMLGEFAMQAVNINHKKWTLSDIFDSPKNRLGMSDVKKGTPCPKCSSPWRYVNNRNCIICHRIRMYGKNAEKYVEKKRVVNNSSDPKMSEWMYKRW
jgi:hypothetical protein